MKLYTRQELADKAAANWKKFYVHQDDEWRSVPRAYSKYQAVVALGAHPDPDTVNEVLGRGYTNLYCDECGRVADAVVEFGQEPENTGRTVMLCPLCARVAVAMFDEQEERST